MIENSEGGKQTAFQEFPGVQQDAQKEFANVPPPESPSAGSILKKLLSPELSPSPEPKYKPISNIKSRVHQFDIGSEIFYYRYDEPSYTSIYGDSSPEVLIHGPMVGYYLNYTYRPVAPNLFNNFLTDVYFLQVRYVNSHGLEYSAGGIKAAKHNEADEIRGLIGKDYFIGKNSRVTPYFGLGYRYLLDRGDGETATANGINYAFYDRKSHYYYLPLGGDVAINMPKDWEIDLNAEYDIFLQGYQKSFNSDSNQFGGNNQDLVNHQDFGFGVRASVKFLKHGPVVDYYMEPFIRFWNIDQSKPESQAIDGPAKLWVEPKNYTTEIGSKFGIQF